MKGLERQYLRECIRALCEARSQFLNMSCKEAVAKGLYGKQDTLSLDGFPEMIIGDVLAEFDPTTPLLTEEVGSNFKLRATEEEFICFSDPMDRSKVLAKFLEQYLDQKIVEVFSSQEALRNWENQCGGDIDLSGPYGSITAVRHYNIIFNVMINYITGVLYVASDEGVGSLQSDKAFEGGDQKILKRSIDIINMLAPVKIDNILSGSNINAESIVSYCQDNDYISNLLASKIFGNQSIEEIQQQHFIEDQPGGPARILYLKSPRHAGFILANGEKIGEWLGWLAYVRHLWPKLRAFELSFDPSSTRNQILMAPGPAYSILGDHIEEDMGRTYKVVRLNIAKLRYLNDPSRYRSTILVCPATNRDLILRIAIQRSPELRFSR